MLAYGARPPPGNRRDVGLRRAVSPTTTLYGWTGALIKPRRVGLMVATAMAGAIITVNWHSRGSDPGDQTCVLARAATAQDAVVRGAVLDDEWLQNITSERFWRSSRPKPRSVKRTIKRSSPRRRQRPAPVVLTGYRTVCVRLCDGAFFPISQNASSRDFARDAAQCQRRCPTGRLFVQRGADPDINLYSDLKGQPYSGLGTANLFRTTYDLNCKCKPHPWEQVSRLRHHIYALAERIRNGDKAASLELARLKNSARTATVSEPRAGSVQAAANAPRALTLGAVSGAIEAPSLRPQPPAILAPKPTATPDATTRAQTAAAPALGAEALRVTVPNSATQAVPAKRRYRRQSSAARGSGKAAKSYRNTRRRNKR